MKRIEFPYSKVPRWSNLIVLGLMFAWNIYMLIRNSKITGHFGWTWIIIALCFYLAIIIYTIFKYTIPSIRKKPALILDEEKLEDRVGKRIIYWKDITHIDNDSLNILGLKIVVTLKGSINKTIDGSYVEGKNSVIYDTISSYYLTAYKKLNPQPAN